jgi:hypothetical protein
VSEKNNDLFFGRLPGGTGQQSRGLAVRRIGPRPVGRRVHRALTYPRLALPADCLGGDLGAAFRTALFEIAISAQGQLAESSADRGSAVFHFSLPGQQRIGWIAPGPVDAGIRPGVQLGVGYRYSGVHQVYEINQVVRLMAERVNMNCDHLQNIRLGAGLVLVENMASRATKPKA